MASVSSSSIPDVESRDHGQAIPLRFAWPSSFVGPARCPSRTSRHVVGWTRWLRISIRGQPIDGPAQVRRLGGEMVVQVAGDAVRKPRCDWIHQRTSIDTHHDGRRTVGSGPRHASRYRQQPRSVAVFLQAHADGPLFAFKLQREVGPHQVAHARASRRAVFLGGSSQPASISASRTLSAGLSARNVANWSPATARRKFGLGRERALQVLLFPLFQPAEQFLGVRRGAARLGMCSASKPGSSDAASSRKARERYGSPTTTREV